MIWRIRIGRWRFTFTLARTTTVTGVNSKLDSGEHILMWDFDDKRLADVRNALELTQETYGLPAIYILETKKDKNYIAYCFKRLEWRKVVEIITYTPNVDWGFIKYGIFREHFTLRVTPKSGRRPKLVWILRSNVPEDAYITDLKSWVKYETLEDGQTVKMHEVKVP